jgi:hypothetical protein
MSSIDQPPEKSKPITKKNTTPTTTIRRNVPAKRGTAVITRQYSLRNLLAEIAEPLALIERVGPHYTQWVESRFSRDRLALAQQLNQLMPSHDDLFSAAWTINEALNKRLDDDSAAVMLTMLLDAVGKRAPTGEAAATKIKLMLGAIADIGDPIANRLGVNADDPPDPTRFWGNDNTMDRPVSPIVLALAVKKLIAHQIFELTTAEVRKACFEAFRSIRGQMRGFGGFMEAREEIDQLLLRDGSDEEKATARRALMVFDDEEDDESDDEQARVVERGVS